jgi:hypothetical protein
VVVEVYRPDGRVDSFNVLLHVRVVDALAKKLRRAPAPENNAVAAAGV